MTLLPFFTDPYPDELLYSAIARYHFYSGNIDSKDTLEEVFQSHSVIPSILIGSHFSVLAQRLGAVYSIECLLGNHTIYPYYSPFLSKWRQQEILQDVYGNGQGLYTRLGLVAGGICRKDGLYYCPSCAVDDIEQYGEPYVHREHQLQGIDYCGNHTMKLKRYPIDFSMQSRIEYIRFDEKLMNLLTLKETEPKEVVTIQIALARMASQLLQVPMHQFSRELINLKYRALLRERHLVTNSNRIRQNELYKAFQSKFPKGFLEKYESDIDMNDEYNWLKVITRNLRRHVHPFRHLLMIYFLNQDVESFLRIEADNGPFGKGPWPCLNKVAVHFKRDIISKVTVTRDYKSNAPIGTFKCDCGFIYARKGPDMFIEDKFRIGRIKVFGYVWEDKVRTLANERKLSTRAMARILGVDSKTVKKYLNEHGKKVNVASKGNPLLQQQYREQLLLGIQQYTDSTRTQIRKIFPKQYMYLYRYDKNWLFEQLPQRSKKGIFNVVVDWSARDKEYYTKVKQLYMELMDLDKPIRITNSLIGKRLGILANLDRHIDKIPKTRKLLIDIKESTQQFQIRRCCKIIDRMMQEQEPIALWKVQRIGALRSNHFHEIKPHLEAYIRIKQEVENNEQTTG